MWLLVVASGIVLAAVTADGDVGGSAAVVDCWCWAAGVCWCS